jgi:hypothetical protein
MPAARYSGSSRLIILLDGWLGLALDMFYHEY